MRRTIAGLTIAILLSVFTGTALGQSGTLRIGMTASDIPYTGGQADNGFEGLRFVGYQIYEPLINWDLTHGDRLATPTPGLAESWSVNKATPTLWTFKLRKGVQFHDGSSFNADSVVFTFESVKNKDAAHFDRAGASNTGFRLSLIKSVKRIDDYTVEFESVKSSSFLPYQLLYLMMVSPANWTKVGKDWRKYAESPSGTGPYRVTKFVPRERLELEANKAYWNPKRMPKTEKLVLLPMPEPTTRLAALRSGQVDWVEVPPPDSIGALKAQGFQIVTGQYPHNWGHTLRLDKAPWDNKLLRKAANYAIDRVGICKSLLNNTCVPGTGVTYKGHPWFGNPKETYEYDPDKARALIKQAGYGDGRRPPRAVHLISTSGSGQMLPLAMNELVQKNLKDVGIDVDLQPIEWNSLTQRFRIGFTGENAGVNALNISFNFLEPFSGFGRFFHSKSVPPTSVNIMPFVNPESDKLLDEAEKTFDLAKQDAILAKVHEVVVDEAPWIFVVHDLNPRAMSPKVKGFVPPQSWFVDLTQVSVAK